jgi:Transposase DDE domain group 1
LEAAPLYEDLYCGRGERENHLQQMQLDLQATRMSTHWMASNRLWVRLTAFGCLLLERLRTITLTSTVRSRASLWSIRLRLLKVAAQVPLSVRRVHVRLASADPLQSLLASCLGQLLRLTTATG